MGNRGALSRRKTEELLVEFGFKTPAPPVTETTVKQQGAGSKFLHGILRHRGKAAASMGKALRGLPKP